MIYFDNSATTKPYPEVIESFAKVAGEYFGNPSSLHGLGASSERLLQKARKQIADLLNAMPSEIVFTSGGTEGNNLAIKGAVHAAARNGNHIITTEMEHASVLETCRALEQEGFEVTYLPVTKDGSIVLSDLIQAIREDTILVSIMHVNNEIGSIQPIEEIGRYLADFPKIMFHVDHVQGIGKVPLDFNQSHIDLCTMSGHKFHGLKGTGILYVRSHVKLRPLFTGGNQESKLRSGTENVAGIVAMAKALRMTLNKQKQASDIAGIRDYLMNELKKIDGVKINSPESGAPHIVNFSIPGIKSEVFIHALEESGIFASTTSACSSKNKAISETVLAMFDDLSRAESVIRISTSYENNLEEAKAVIQAVIEKMAKLQKVMR